MKTYQIMQIFKKEVDETNATLEAIFSTENEDRHGDIVKQDWDLKDFKKNPVILNSHNYEDAGEVIGKVTKIKVDDNKLQGKIVFAVNENPKAKIIFDLYVGGFLNAFSVGFIPKEFDDKGVILKSELLEISAVSVPANARALAKKKGIDVDKLYESNNTNNSKNKEVNEKKSKGENNGDQTDGENSNEEIGTNSGDQENKGVRKKDYEENWGEVNSQITVKIKDIAEFEPGTFKKVEIQKDIPRIFALVGKLKGSDKENIQMLFFPKEDGWTVDDAHKWFTTRQYQTLLPTSHQESKKDDAKVTDGEIEVENEDSVNSGKSINKSQKEIVKNKISEAVLVDGKIYFIKQEKQKNILKKVALVLENRQQEIQVETRQKTDRAEKRKAINQAIRKMVNEKKTIT